MKIRLLVDLASTVGFARKGQILDMDDKQAKVLIRYKRAEAVVETPAPETASLPAPEPGKKKQPAVRRRRSKAR